MNFKRYHVSKNLFDYSTVTTGYRIQWITGADYADATAVRSDYIPVNSGTYSCSDSVIVLGYDANKDYLGATNGDGVFEKIAKNPISQFTVPTNSLCKYIKILAFNSSVSTNIDAETMLNTGSTPQPYEPYSSEVWTDTPHYIHKTDTDILTTLPDVVYVNDTTVTVGLKGNMSQSGTPTPTTPIQPSECGERTGNLFDYNAYFDSVFTPYNEFFNYAEIQLQPNTTYALSTSIKEIGHIPRNTAFIVATSNETPTTASGGISNVSPITKTTESDGILKLYKRISGTGVMPTKDLFDAGDWLMLNTGSTPLPYEPWGIKIPILSGGVTTPVYLGEVQTTRKIKKYEFTGSETWNRAGSTHGYFTDLPNEARTAGATDIISSHYVPAMSGADGTVRIGNSKTEVLIYDNYTSVTDFKAYLAQQYANGTPVTIWYVLATPQTAVVNEPLRKIGNYADEVSGITIPTIAGANSFDVLTTLKPSEVTVTYKGWHTGAVHERDSGQWD